MALGVGHGVYVGATKRSRSSGGFPRSNNNRRSNNTSAWDDAIKRQEFANKQAQFTLLNERVRQLCNKGAEEDMQRRNRAELMSREDGAMILAASKSGGFLRQSSVNDYNSANGTNWTAFGLINPVTGRKYDDGLYHFAREGKDKYGNRVLTADRPVDAAFTTMVLRSGFGQSILQGKDDYAPGTGNLNSRDMEMLRQKNREELQQERSKAQADRDFYKSLGKQRAERESAMGRDGDLTVPKYTQEENDAWEQSQIDAYNNRGNGGSSENKDNKPYVTRGVLSVPGVENYISPGQSFNVNGQDYVWDGKEDGGLRSHISKVSSQGNEVQNTVQNVMNSNESPEGSGVVSVTGYGDNGPVTYSNADGDDAGLGEGDGEGDGEGGGSSDGGGGGDES